MNYRARRQGEDLGVFSLEELRRHRESGVLTGAEYVQEEGRSDWQPLDLVLRQGYRVVPPPVPSSVAHSGPSPGLIGLMIAGGVLIFVLIVIFFGYAMVNFQRGYQSTIRSARAQRSLEQPRPEAVAAASKPVLLTTNGLTEAEVQKQGREFRIRQWLEGYEKRGQRNPACDAEMVRYLQTWIARNYGGLEATNRISIERMTEQLAADTNCTDPLVLAVVANNSRNSADNIHRFERALNAFPQSHHAAYPRFYATVVLTQYLDRQPDRVNILDRAALDELQKCFTDGSFTPADQQEAADIFVNGWGARFFGRNGTAVCRIANEAGPAYQWLALTLDGEHQIAEAWKARGGGYAGTVTEPGWQAFHHHLAAAQKSLVAAWNLRPDFPLAPCRMIYVSLGDSGIEDMRVWFDRTLAAQVDYPEAWSDMRWGLRPRWYGNETAMLALGRTAINTGRFDTDVPYEFFNCVSDVESELSLPTGRHIYGRDDVWPDLKRMYDGYIAACVQSHSRRLNSWRSYYTVMAYFAGKYDVARSQLEAMNWQPESRTLSEWQLDPSLLPLEIAARTGPQAGKIAAAELLFQHKDLAEARRQYTYLSAITNQDARTREFIQRRLATLSAVQISPQFKLQLSPPPATN